MISITTNKTYKENGSVDTQFIYWGNSSDAKPATTTNASIFIEMNTGKVYLFDENTWREF